MCDVVVVVGFFVIVLCFGGVLGFLFGWFLFCLGFFVEGVGECVFGLFPSNPG